MSEAKYSAVFVAVSRALLISSIFLVAPAAQATLIGTTVGAQLEGVQNITVGKALMSPAKVDDTFDPEFSGTALDARSSALNVSVDILADSFVIDTFSAGQWGTRAGDGLSILLTGLDWLGSFGVITDVALIGSKGTTDRWDLDFANLISFDANSIAIQLLLTRPAIDSASFEFGITAAGVPSVSEPATAGLLLFALLGIAFRRRAAL